MEKTNPSARHHARSYAVQAIYQWQISGNELRDIEHDFISRHIDRALDMDYFKELLHTIPQKQEDIDQTMKPFLGRSLQSIDPVELAVLRIAVYELLERPDVPYRVIINEALELTKQFGSIEGYKFVNGILDQVAKKCREIEVAQNNK